MEIKNQLINKDLNLNKTESLASDLAQQINQRSHYYVFPFEIQGCVNITETGIKPENLSLQDYSYFSKVISGDTPIIAT
jgi:hypothetical protein